MKKSVKKVCKCENCGNESEMTVTCTLPDEGASPSPGPAAVPSGDHQHQVKGSATCTHCGNEADMWIDI